MTRNDVLIVGAGPSGLFVAAELARHGVAVRLIEREVRPHREACATAIQPGTLEILDSVGLLSPFLEAAEHVRCSRIYGKDMVEMGAARFDGIDCRYGFQCSLPQYETQRILEARLASLGGVVERGVTATKIEAGANGDQVELVHPGGRAETLHPGVVIGAGGAHSVTPLDERTPRRCRHLPREFPRRRHRDADAVSVRDEGTIIVCGPGRPTTRSRRSRAGAGSVSRTWKRRSRLSQPKTLSPGLSDGSVANADPTTSPGSRRFGCTGGSSRAWRTAGGS